MSERTKNMEEEKKKEETKEEETKEESKETESEDSSSQKDTELDTALEDEKRKSGAKERFDEKKNDETEEEEKPLTRKEFERLTAERDDKIRKETRAEQAKEIASELAESPKEADLILAVWNNRRLGGTLREQLQEAHAIATHKRTLAKNLELKRALANKDGVTTDGTNAQRKPQEGEAPKIEGADKQVLKGFTWDNTKRAYRKLIAGGRKTLFVSQDMKKRWVENAPKQ